MISSFKLHSEQEVFRAAMSLKCVTYPRSYDTIADSEFTPVACLIFVIGDDVMHFVNINLV